MANGKASLSIDSRGGYFFLAISYFLKLPKDNTIESSPIGAEKPNSVPEKDPKYIPVDLEFIFLTLLKNLSVQ
jgi:hypothetical protein